MKSQKYNHITRVLLAVGLFSITLPALAAQVPPGTVLAESRSWSEITAASRRRWIRIKSKATLKTISLAIFSKGWSAFRRQATFSPGWRRSGRIKITPSGPSTCVQVRPGLTGRRLRRRISSGAGSVWCRRSRRPLTRVIPAICISSTVRR